MHDFNTTQPIYLQLMDDMKGRIVAGSLALGEKMAPVRDLATAYGVNPNTVQRALSELERTGLLYTQRTSGRFVTENQAMVDSLRADLAQERTTQLVSYLVSLGFTGEEIRTMIMQCLKELK